MSKKSTKKYQVLNAYPSQTIEQWLSDYNNFLANYYATPKTDKWAINQYKDILKKIADFLKSNGIKFI